MLKKEECNMDYNEYFEILERELDHTLVNIDFYEKLKALLEKRQTEFDNLVIEKMLTYEFGEQDFSKPYLFIKEINEKLNQQLLMQEEIENLQINSFTSILELLYTNPRNMKESLTNFCNANGLNFYEFTQRTNAKKIEAIFKVLFDRDFIPIIDSLTQKQVKDSNKIEHRNRFLDALDREEVELEEKRKVAQDFFIDARREQPIDPTQSSEYDISYNKLNSIYENTLSTSWSLDRTKSMLKVSAINEYMREAKQKFSDAMDQYIPNIKGITIELKRD